MSDVTGSPAPAPAPASAPAPAPGGDNPVAPWGTDDSRPWTVGDKPWYDVFVPEGPTRELIKAKNYANPRVVADSYFALNKQFNDPNRLSIPPEGADEKTMNEFYTKLGRPESADKYDMKFDPTVKVDPKFLEFGKKLSFKLGLDPKGAQTLGNEWNGFIAVYNEQMAIEQAKANDDALGALKTTLGVKYEPSLAAGTRAFQALKANKDSGMTEADFAAIESHIGAAPLAKLLIAIGNLSGEAGFVGGAPGGGAPGTPEAMSPEQAAAEITRLGGDVEFQKKFGVGSHPEHKAAVDIVNRLYAKAGNKITL